MTEAPRGGTASDEVFKNKSYHSPAPAGGKECSPFEKIRQQRILFF
jgi:hypothetical protein